jgi:hypothetical protein
VEDTSKRRQTASSESPLRHPLLSSFLPKSSKAASACLKGTRALRDDFATEGSAVPTGRAGHRFRLRGMGLTYTLRSDYDTLVLVEAIPHGGLPGTLYLKVLILVAAIVILQQLTGIQRYLRTRSI